MKRGRQSTTTPQAKARQPGRHKSNQIPRGRDQHRNWARTPQGTNHRGEEGNKRRGRGRGPRQTRTNAQKPHHTQSGTPQPKKRHLQKRRPKHKHNKHTTKRSQAQEEAKQGTKDKPAARRARPKPRARKVNKGGGPWGGIGPQEGPQKRPPPHSRKREQITTRCPGERGTEGPKRQKRDSPNQRGEEKRGGGRYVILRVVYSR